MNHRHLLPNEIDLLVDGDAGFGVAPLRAHLGECAECTARVDELRTVVGALDALPHFTPRMRFANDIMAKVQVIEPWHVAALDTLKRIVPATGPMRALAAAGAGAVAVTISGSALWLAFRADLATWAFNFFVDRGRTALMAGAGEVGGLPVLAFGGLLLAASAVASVAFFRRLVAKETARAARS